MNQQALAAELLRLSAQLLSQSQQTNKTETEPETGRPRRIARLLEVIAKVPPGSVRVAPHRLEYTYDPITLRIPIPASMQELTDEEVKDRLLVAYTIDVVERPDGVRYPFLSARPAPQNLNGRLVLTEGLIPHIAAITSHLITRWCDNGVAKRMEDMVPKMEDVDRWKNAQP